MKEVTIKSKIVGRGGASAATSPGKGVSVDMSGYLLKQIWEKVFEFRLTDDGTEYLFAKMNVAAQGGFTSFVDGGKINLPGLYDGIPFDNRTIWMNPETGVVEVLVSGGEGGAADFSHVQSSGTGNAFTSFNVSADGSRLTLVKGETFALKSVVDELSDILSEKADLASTLAGYGITNAYTKAQVDDLLEGKADLASTLAGYGITNAYTKAQVDDLLSEIGSPEELPNPYALTWSGYSSGSYDGSSAKSIVIPNNTNQLTNGAGFITSSGTAAYAGALSTARTISLTGQATGSTTFDGSANKSIAVTIPTRSVRFNGKKYTVLTNSDTTDDMPNIYAADYAGTANQVLVSGGSGSAPSWVNQSSITSGACSGNAATATTASKLSTTSKTAWGQTYWTSGGVPTSIDGNMSNVGHIALKSHNAYDIGTDSVGVRYIYANWIGGVSGGNFSIGANDSTAITILTDKSVGIGTTNPKSKLHVAGSVQADNTFFLTSNDNGSGVYGFFQGGKLLLRKDGSGNTILSADSGGIYLRPNGSIYATAQSVIDTSGNLLVAGGVTMYSDLRKKTILNHVELSLKEVADAPLIEHYYNSDEKKTTHVGSVAQYWAELNDWFCKEDEEGFLTMEIQNAALASAISVARELTRYESKTDKQIKKLKKRIGELEEEIEKLKKM